jgi:hypothetical protein
MKRSSCLSALLPVLLASAHALCPAACASGPTQTGAANQAADIPGLLKKLIAADEVERGDLMDQFDQIQDANLLVPPVLAALDTVDPQQAWKLLDILARFPNATKPGPLIRLAAKFVGNVPLQVTTQLSALGDRARPPIVEAIRDACLSWQPVPQYAGPTKADDAELRQRTTKAQAFLDWATVTLAQTGPQGVDAALQMLHAQDACHRTAASEALAKYALSYGPELKTLVVPAITAALSDHDTAVQGAAANALEPIVGYDLTPLSPEIIEPLFSILRKNPDARARITAFSILRRGSREVAKKAAEIAVHDPDDELQNEADRFLEELSDQPQASVDFLSSHRLA